MRSGLEIGPDAAAPRVLLIRCRFSRGNCQAYTNQCGRYQQLLPRSTVSSALLGKNLPGFLGLLHALVQGLLRSLLGLPQLAFAPQDARQVEVGLAVRRQRGGLPVVRSEEHTSELQSLMRISYAVFCLKKQTHQMLISTQ